MAGQTIYSALYDVVKSLISNNIMIINQMYGLPILQIKAYTFAVEFEVQVLFYFLVFRDGVRGGRCLRETVEADAEQARADDDGCVS